MKTSFNVSIKLAVARLILPEFTIERAVLNEKNCYLARCHRLRWEMSNEGLTQLVADIIARLMKTAEPGQ